MASSRLQYCIDIYRAKEKNVSPHTIFFEIKQVIALVAHFQRNLLQMNSKERNGPYG
jgi:hypothetical protein